VHPTPPLRTRTVRLNLRPRDDSFYELFIQAARNLVRGTELLSELA